MAPDKKRIAEIFAHLADGNSNEFFNNVDPNVEWTVMSQSVLGGTYKSAADFRTKTFARLEPIMDDSTPMKLVVQNIIGGGPGEEWCTVEMRNSGKAKNGMRYDQTYAWCVKWDDDSGKIVQVRAYLDSALLKDVVEGNE